MIITRLKQTCHSFPSQWEGLVSNDDYLYIRFRFGRGYIEVDGKLVYEWTTDNPYGGEMTKETLLKHLDKAGFKCDNTEWI